MATTSNTICVHVTITKAITNSTTLEESTPQLRTAFVFGVDHNTGKERKAQIVPQIFEKRNVIIRDRMVIDS